MTVRPGCRGRGKRTPVVPTGGIIVIAFITDVGRTGSGRRRLVDRTVVTVGLKSGQRAAVPRGGRARRGIERLARVTAEAGAVRAARCARDVAAVVARGGIALEHRHVHHVWYGALAELVGLDVCMDLKDKRE